MNDERFISPCKPPEGLEREIIEIMHEECDEIGQRISKAQRFGLKEIQPGQTFTNAERIAHEIGDLWAVIEMALEHDLICQADIQIGINSKVRQLSKYMQNQTSADCDPKSCAACPICETSENDDTGSVLFLILTLSTMARDMLFGKSTAPHTTN